MLRRQSLQESPDRGLIRIPAQADDPLEGAVVLQDLSFVDAVHPSNDRVENGKDHFGRTVISKSRSRADALLKQPLEADLSGRTAGSGAFKQSG